MVKTIRFEDGAYLGDPVNVINLFNRFEVDEIALLDVRATVRGNAPSFDLIEQLASECWVPLSYGGGIRSLSDVRRVLSSGVEKVVLGTIAADEPSLIGEAASIYGSQAVIVAIDVRRHSSGSKVCVESGSRVVASDPTSYARAAQAAGAGEILLTSVDRDGTMDGYDLDLIRAVTSAVDIPVIACGGAGSRSDIPLPIVEAGAAAVAAGSIFVYQSRERGVLINYPSRPSLEALFD